MREQAMRSPARSYTVRDGQRQKTFTFGSKIKKNYTINKGGDQLRSNCEAELCPCFRICKTFVSYNAARII